MATESRMGINWIVGYRDAWFKRRWWSKRLKTCKARFRRSVVQKNIQYRCNDWRIDEWKILFPRQFRTCPSLAIYQLTTYYNVFFWSIEIATSCQNILFGLIEIFFLIEYLHFPTCIYSRRPYFANLVSKEEVISSIRPFTFKRCAVKKVFYKVLLECAFVARMKKFQTLSF